MKDDRDDIEEAQANSPALQSVFLIIGSFLDALQSIFKPEVRESMKCEEFWSKGDCEKNNQLNRHRGHIWIEFKAENGHPGGRRCVVCDEYAFNKKQEGSNGRRDK